MRRKTPAAEEFGSFLFNRRAELRMTMRDVGTVLGRKAAYVSEAEKGLQAVKEPMIPLWAKALHLTIAEVRGHWNLAQRNPEPPIKRRPALKAEAKILQDKIATLTEEERTRVYGYIDALLAQR